MLTNTDIESIYRSYGIAAAIKAIQRELDSTKKQVELLKQVKKRSAGSDYRR